MAATNFTPIQLYFSTTASAVPLAANLAQGELAINITDGKLYYEDNGGVVQVIATKGTGTIGGSTTQIQYNNAGALAGNAAMVFNNSTNVTTLTTLNLTNVLGAIYGGTAQSTYTQGDVLYASAANTLSKLGIGTVNYILTSSGSVPQWSAPSSISVLTATNLDGGAAGSVPYQSAAATTTFLAIGAANRVMTSTGSAPQWVTALTGLTGVSSSSITNTSLTSGRVVVSTTAGLQADDADLTFDGTTLSAGGLSTVGLSTLVKTVKIGDSSFNGVAVFAAATPAKLYMGTGTVTDVTSAISATNAIGAIASLGITPIAATNTSVTYTDAATLYIAGAPSAGTNVTLTNPYSLYVAAGAAYFGGAVTVAGSLSLAAVTVTSLTDSGLTSGRVTYAGTGGLLQDSANLTFNGTTLTANTIGAFTLGGTVSGGGNQINNVIIGTTTPLAGSFTTLSATATVTMNASGLTAPLILTPIGTTYGGLSFNNTNNSATMIGLFGGTDSNLYVNVPTGGLVVSRVNGTPVTQISSTALALQSGVSLTGGTSGTGFSFSGSAPATSLTLDASGRLDVVRSSTNTGTFSEPEIRAINSGAATLNQRIDIGMRFQDGVYNGIGGISMVRESATDNMGSLVLCPIDSSGNPLEAVVITSSGNLGIGTNSPSTALDVASSNSGITLTNTAVSNKKWRLGGSSAGAFQITETAVADRFTIDTSGNVQTYGTISVGNVTPSSSGAGITFPATQSASSDANTLDDYEEGSFTPAISATGVTAYSIRNGKYTKIGQVVVINVEFTVQTSTGSTGVFTISNAPFTQANYQATASARESGLGTGFLNSVWMVASSTNILVEGAQFAAGYGYAFTIVYQV